MKISKTAQKNIERLIWTLSAFVMIIFGCLIKDLFILIPLGCFIIGNILGDLYLK